MSNKRKKEKEYSVRAPDYIPKKAPIFKDTTGTEALDVFKLAKTIGRLLSFVMFGIGILVAVMAAYSLINAVNIFLNPMFLGVFGVIGAINIFCGLILLAKK